MHAQEERWQTHCGFFTRGKCWRKVKAGKCGQVSLPSMPSTSSSTNPPKENHRVSKRPLEESLQQSSQDSPHPLPKTGHLLDEPPQHRPVFIEAFAGTANLSKHMFEAGFDVVAIDYKSKHTAKFSCIGVDLSSKSGQQLFWEIVDTTKPCAIHCGVACGTAPRARERDIPQHLLQAGAPSRC